MGIDSYYTPKYLADKLVSFTKKQNVTSICDFCVGDGELLRSAEKKWINANIFGVDISQEVVNKTSKKHPNWEVVCEDFLRSNYKKEFDIILLNPPFSCKGSKVNIINFDGQAFKVSTAMLFLLKAINYLHNEGNLYAILPSSVAFSQKDREAWDYLKASKHAKIIDYIEGKVFEGCMPNIIIVSINDTDIEEHNVKNFLPQKSYEKKVKSIKRGQITPKFITQNDVKGYPLIHTTNLSNNSLKSLSVIIDTSYSIIEGPAIVLPRVGRPNLSKVCIIPEKESYAISDCIIAIQTFTSDQSLELSDWICKNWKEFLKLYNGTGAKYLTISGLKKIIPTNSYPSNISSI